MLWQSVPRCRGSDSEGTTPKVRDRSVQHQVATGGRAQSTSGAHRRNRPTEFSEVLWCEAMDRLVCQQAQQRFSHGKGMF